MTVTSVTKEVFGATLTGEEVEKIFDTEVT